MSKYANISVLSAGQIVRPYTDNTDELVNAYIQHWDNEFQKVLPDEPDLIIMPECCDTYFCHTTEQRFEYLKAKSGIMLEHLKQVAIKNHCNIAYSAERYFPEDEKYPSRNSTTIITRDGSIAGIYDKNHPTIRANEVNRSGYSDKAEVIDTDFARIGCAICFDLNFDELLDKYIPQSPDLIAFSSMYHGGRRQVHWAYMCRAYVASSVVGDQSRIINPFGEEVASTTNYRNWATGRVNFDYTLAHLAYNEAKFAAAKKKYGRDFVVHDPGYVGAVMLSCERDDMTVFDIVREFEIELLDDYFARSLKHYHENVGK